MHGVLLKNVYHICFLSIFSVMFVKSDATKINGSSEVHYYVKHMYVEVVHSMYHMWKDQ